MASLHRLTDTKIRQAKGPVILSDGGGLYLRIRSGKGWLFIYTTEGKRSEMSLGSYPAVSLARARELAGEARELRASGVDPMTARKAKAAEGVTFGEVANRVIEMRSQAFRNPKHRQQWRNTLETYCAAIWSLPVCKVDRRVVWEVLEPIWLSKPETAQRLRGRIEKVLDTAFVEDLREGANPAVWKGNLEHLLPHHGSEHRGHHKALDWSALPAFMHRLRGIDVMSARALEFLILTATRSWECRGAQWSEIDFEKAVWVIPSDRMKMRQEHRVPLSDAAIACLRSVERSGADYLFPGAIKDRPLAGTTFARLLERMEVNVTPHGFRSTFRDWTADETHHDWFVGEAALAHRVGGKVERAYRRNDALEKRRLLMSDWATYAGSCSNA